MSKKTDNTIPADNSLLIEKINVTVGRIEETQEKGFAFLEKKIDKIPTTQAPPPSPQEPPAATPFEVTLPDDIARSGDIRKLGEAMQITNGSMKTVVQGMGELSKSIAEIPHVDAKSMAETVATATATKVEANLLPKIQQAVKDAVPSPQPTKAPAIGVDDIRSINAKLSRIEQNIDFREKCQAQSSLIKKIGIILIVDMLIAVGSLWWVLTLREENEHLRRVEWLYRWSRNSFKDSETFQDFERKMLYGTKEERENYKTVIFNNERTVPQFQYFRPSTTGVPNRPSPKTMSPSKSHHRRNHMVNKSRPSQRLQRSNPQPVRNPTSLPVKSKPSKPSAPTPTSPKTPSLPSQTATKSSSLC